MKFGEIIGRVSSFVRFNLSSNPEELFSVKGMRSSELLKIAQEGEEIFSLIRPIVLEHDHILMERFLYNPKMTPGEIREHFNSQFDFIVEAVRVELRRREKK